MEQRPTTAEIAMADYYQQYCGGFAYIPFQDLSRYKKHSKKLLHTINVTNKINSIMAIMKEIDYNEIGTHFDLDECGKAYKFGGVNISWLDYTYPKPTCEDGMWDLDKYYNDFDKWWKNLSQEEQKKICIKINSEYGTN